MASIRQRVCWLATTIIGLTPVQFIDAQVTGRVTTNGVGLPDASIELWSGTAMLAARRSGADGGFAFTAGEASGASGLLARRIGFRPITLPLTTAQSPLAIELEEFAAPLPTVVSTAVAAACPNREDARARALWSAVRRHYFPVPYRYGLAYAVAIDSSVVRATDLGTVAESRQFEYGQSIGAAKRLADSARIVDVGYAFEYKVSALQPTRFHKADRRWRYPQLQSYMAQHFLDGVFGERHDMSIVSTNDAETVIGFCPRRSVPSMSGTLVVRADTTLVTATWRFRTEAPDDDAGGTVTFIPPPQWSRAPMLLPAESTSWRRSPGEFREFYRQEVAHYRRWNAQDTVSPVRLSSPAPNASRRP